VDGSAGGFEVAVRSRWPQEFCSLDVDGFEDGFADGPADGFKDQQVGLEDPSGTV
jgi:hypothetical protein